MTISTIRRHRGAETLAAAGLAAAVALALVAAPMAGRTPAAAPTPQGLVPTFSVEEALAGYSRPVDIVSSGAQKRLFIVEQTGKIKVATRTSISDPWVKSGVFLNIRGLVHDPLLPGNNERGLLGLAFDPDYARSGLFYVYYTRESDNKNVLVEYHRDTALKADPSSARVVFGIPHSAGNHNGGSIHFGPDDYLYVTTGDNANGNNARDTNTRHGKVLRLDPSDPPGSARYTVPPDNPYAGGGGHPLVWSWGLRNPWRASFDDLTGDLWLGDVGELSWEEVDHMPGPDSGKDVDFGWDLCEGEHPEDGSAADCGEPPNTTQRPVLEYSSGTGSGQCAVTGGRVYRGTEQTSLVGYYFFGDYCSGDIWAVPESFDDPDGSTLPAPLATSLNVVGFGTDALGELYVADLGGTIQHIVED
jgi:glucose/arabinose dehydrogenase